MEHPSIPLYAQHPQQRFSNRAKDYAEYRPSYPAAAIDQILAGLDQPIAADVERTGRNRSVYPRTQ